jgi:ATP-dependent Lhr-like helicase
MKDQDRNQQTNQLLESLFGKFGFSKLTEIQKKVSPIILQRKDCFVIVPTGSGKTERQ